MKWQVSASEQIWAQPLKKKEKVIDQRFKKKKMYREINVSYDKVVCGLMKLIAMEFNMEELWINVGIKVVIIESIRIFGVFFQLYI